MALNQSKDDSEIRHSIEMSTDSHLFRNNRFLDIRIVFVLNYKSSKLFEDLFRLIFLPILQLFSSRPAMSSPLIKLFYSPFNLQFILLFILLIILIINKIYNYFLNFNKKKFSFNLLIDKNIFKLKLIKTKLRFN